MEAERPHSANMEQRMRGRLLRLRSRRRNGLNAVRVEDAPKGRQLLHERADTLGRRRI